MKELRQLAASTRVDKHAHRIAPDALRGMARDLEIAPIRATIEHDRTIPPWGKTIRGEVVEAADGELELYVTSVPYDRREVVILPTGQEAIRLWTAQDDRSLTSQRSIREGTGNLLIEIDPANFGKKEDLQAFADALRDLGEFDSGMQFRKSAVPDPMLVVTIAQAFLLLLALKTANKTADKIADEMSDEVLRAYKVLRRSPREFVKFASPKGRTVTIVYILEGEPLVHLVVRSRKTYVHERAVKLEEMRKCVEEAKGMQESLGAVEVQYLYDEKNGWQFSYLLTNSGEVVGTRQTISELDTMVSLNM